MHKLLVRANEHIVRELPNGIRATRDTGFHDGRSEWVYVAHSIAGLLLVAMSFSPAFILTCRPAKWSLVLVVGFVEFAVALIVYRDLSRSYDIYVSTAAGSEFAPERASLAMRQYAMMGVIAAALGVLLGLSAKRLLASPKT